MLMARFNKHGDFERTVDLANRCAPLPYSCIEYLAEAYRLIWIKNKSEKNSHEVGSRIH